MAARSAEPRWPENLQQATRSPRHRSPLRFRRCLILHQAGVTERSQSCRAFCLKACAGLLCGTPTDAACKVFSGLLCGLRVFIIHFPSVAFEGPQCVGDGAAGARRASESFLFQSNSISVGARVRCNVALQQHVKFVTPFMKRRGKSLSHRADN